MRVSIGGFVRFGARAQFGAQAHTIVAIARIRGEQLLEDQEKLPEAFFTIAEGGAERLIQVASRGMEGTAERLSIGREDIAVLRTDARCDINKIEAGAGGEVQEHFSGWCRHHVSPGWLRGNALPRCPCGRLQGHGDGEAWLRHRPHSGRRLAGDRHPGRTAGCSNTPRTRAPASLPLSPSVLSPYVAAAFPVSVDGRNTIVPDRGTARSVTVKPPWLLGDGHAVATRVQMFPAAVSCT